MGNRMNDLVNAMVDAVEKATKKRTSSYDSSAIVRRIEGNTAWVHIPGGVDETPVKRTVNAKVGDTVQVRVSGGNAFIVGNASSPPTDDTTANVASTIAKSAKKTADDALENAEIAQRTADEAAEYMAEKVIEINDDIENLQDQVDGNITTWFYNYVPSLSNYPASEWISEGTENVHLGDLFYNTSTGYAYRWMSDGASTPTYSWLRITDVDVTKALNDASKAQDTADKKRRVFITTPTIPNPASDGYDVGDLWFEGSTGDILTCTTAKTSSGTYSSSDWSKLNKYTDDSIADQALQSANGKNKIYYQSSQPTGGTYKTGDTWFDTDDDNKIYRYNGSTWAAVTLGDDAISDLSASKLTAGTIDASVITVSNIDAGNITVGKIQGTQINASSLNVGDLNNDAGFITESDAGMWYTGTAITGTSTTGTIFPSSGISEACLGDMYLNTSTSNVYRCTVAGAASVAKWAYVTNIEGQQGSQGYSVVASVQRNAFTEANWDTYGTIGHYENWSNTESIRNGCRIGDLFLVQGTATDTGRSHELVYRSTTESGTLYGVCINHTYAEKGAQGQQGNGISSINLISTSGKTKTYRITYTNGGTFDFTVQDGADGQDTSAEYFAFDSTNGLRVYSGSKSSSTYNTSYTQIKTNGVDLVSNGVTLAHFGRDTGHTETSTGTAPYYTFGTRRSDTAEDRGNYSLAEGSDVISKGYASHAEGYYTTASGSESHAEGAYSQATGSCAHAEGKGTKALSGTGAHSEGESCEATDDWAHAEGYYSMANADAAHAEGTHCEAVGPYSHAQNVYTKVTQTGQTAIGRYNIVDEGGSTNYGEYVLIIGNGTSTTARSNALAVDWNGGIYIANHSSPIGTVVRATEGTKTVSSSTSSWTTLCSVTLTAGVWMLFGQAKFAKTGTTNVLKRARFYNTTASAAYGDSESSQVTDRDREISITPSGVVELTASGDISYSLQANQNGYTSGNGISVVGNLRAVRIA